MHFIRTAIGFIHFIDHYNRMQVQLQGLLQYKTCLWHRSFKGIDQQYNAICHFKNPFYLSPEVGVTRSINHIDLHSLIHHRDVLTKNSDSSFSFKVVAIHDQVTGFLVLPKYISTV